MITKKIENDINILINKAIQVVSVEELKKKLLRFYQEGIPLKVKLGLDPTSPDIHLGHTVVLNKMREFQDLGHEVILIIGDFTALIGDPSGRSLTRKPLTKDEIEKNASTYTEQVLKILDPSKTKIEYNSKWLRQLGSDGFIRLCSKFTVSQILQREDFSNRLKENKPISVHEIIYPIAQAYDSVMIKADVELGGTDQTFNLLLGRELQKEFGQEPQIIMTMPILEGIDGIEKMSKSLKNYIGITENPSEIFGKIMSISDELMFKYYLLLTNTTPLDIENYKYLIRDNKLNPKDLKINLAKLIIKRFYSEEEAEKAAENFLRFFSEKKLPQLYEVSCYKCQKEKLWIVKLILNEGMAPSQSEARRLIKQGAVYYKILSINENSPTEISIKDMTKVISENFEIDISKPISILLKVGKTKFKAIKFE